MTYQNIRFTVEDRVGRVRLARPPLNTLTIKMMREIGAALNDCFGQREIVALVIDAAAETRAFSAGFAVEEHSSENVYQVLEAFHNIFRALEATGKPMIAVVDGAALGAGCELAAGCDIVIASERARFGQPEIKLGLFPTVASVLLPRLIGEKRARELILTGELIDATEAAQMGMINYVVPTAQLEQKTQEILGHLRELSGPTLEVARRALDAARGRSLEDALVSIENLYLNELMRTEDAREGINAFMEKRKPLWRNR